MNVADGNDVTTMRDVRTDWHGICAVCGLADTDRCVSCPTRWRAFVKMAAVWHDRHRFLVAWTAVGLSVATAFQVVR
jgi:hypothetical protein